METRLNRVLHIIINPAAGRGHSRTVLAAFTPLLETSGILYKIHTTSAPLEARKFTGDICDECVKENRCAGIIGIGGDGTVQEIVAGMADAFKGLVEFPVPLGILPCGSGNDFTLTLKKRSRAVSNGDGASETEKLVRGILRDKTYSVDLITEAFTGNTFINIANMGLDARIVLNAEPLRKSFGRNAYLAAAVKSIVQHRDIRITIEANGKAVRGPFTLTAICNGQYYGGGLRIAPSAMPDDGKITVVLVEAMSRPKIMALFPSIIFEKHTLLKEVRTFTCEEVSLSWEGEQLLCMDGNLSQREGPLKFKILPKALRLYC